MTQIERVATLGCGVIGASWTSLFLANGLAVDAYDPSENAHGALIEAIETAWPVLHQLGYAASADLSRLSFHSNAIDAVRQADFIQESVPEKLGIKHELFALIESHLRPHAIVASSASGLMLSEMQQGWRTPARFMLAHPFNPPHLIPLVELLVNEKTEPDVLPIAEQFYKQLGKVTIQIRREVPAHVANRLQAALWREAISLVVQGVASVEDVDKAVWSGPGLRWAAMGPHQLFHLGAGPGGLAEFCHRYTDSFHRWWDDLSEVELTPDVIDALVTGLSTQATQTSDDHSATTVTDESKRRDALITAILRSTQDLRKTDKQE